MSDKLEGIIDTIAELSVLELSDLVSSLEEKFGVEAAAPMMMGVMPAAGGGDDGAAAEPTSSSPKNASTQGLPVCLASWDKRAATAASGGFEISTSTRVSESPASAWRAARMLGPPSCRCKSRPPTPMACDTPIPWRASRQVTCCNPVPEAAMQPTGPRGSWLAKPSGTPCRTAVPQSGPITSNPRCAASCFNSFSASRST